MIVEVNIGLAVVILNRSREVKAHPKRKNLLSRLAKIFPLFTKKYHN